MFEMFLLTFIPLFVAIDPLSTLPIFHGLTEGFSRVEKRKLALQAVSTAFVVGMLFEIAGSYLFSVLGITSADFRIAGGLLLLIISIREIFGKTTKTTQGEASDEVLGIVPLGIPMIAGPAMMTTLLILHDEHSIWVILTSLSVNLLITLGLLTFSEQIINRLGDAASRGLTKVIAIFLAAIGIMMIRKGIETIILGRLAG